MSGECDVSRGLCCQLQRRHRQAPRKVEIFQITKHAKITHQIICIFSNGRRSFSLTKNYYCLLEQWHHPEKCFAELKEFTVVICVTNHKAQNPLLKPRSRCAFILVSVSFWVFSVCYPRSTDAQRHSRHTSAQGVDNSGRRQGRRL